MDYRLAPTLNARDAVIAPFTPNFDSLSSQAHLEQAGRDRVARTSIGVGEEVRKRHQVAPLDALRVDNSFRGLTTVLTTTPVDVRGQDGTPRTICRIQYAVRLHSSVGRAADS